MDPLSELLTLLKPSSTISSGFDAGGDWSVRFGDQQRQIKCYVIQSGGCWLAVDGVRDPVRLEQGDCFVLPRGLPFRLASDLNLPSIDASTIFPPARAGGMVTINGGGGFSLTGSRFAVGGHHAELLLEMLPPIVHLSQEAERDALRWSIERMMQEVRLNQPGGYLMAQHLAHMMLLQALRMHLANGHQGTGWFFALSDKRLSSAIRAIHADPARHWTLTELGETAGMSRSVFAERFRATVGETPIDYLSRWRMLLACDRLEKGNDPISVVAPALGYQSESAFSKAFKRVVGCSPRQYRGQVDTSPETQLAP
ncbi:MULTISPECIES: AraC family transcriptional regulator [unclassified Neorhizobium]|uniref:AraC family transcriptional regulator n=1 Tax=unclassified Neorhizobium TaxID=2629175 RepID=UPI001FF31696|nr:MULTISPECIES: AraC family transcriptional regulator [unclassified Neorhizobium]MCJ9669061.1 AraC family transcriptional regulator [Neorhizobium sp. SHOUNA12B]MCJ9743098.1 AraC family transcriptional regulator [Neorhizobium sp. SHOUNA12A]